MATLTILSAILPVILEKVISPSLKQLFASFGKEGDLEKLERLLTRIQGVLLYAEQRQTTNFSISIQAWLSSLKNLCYEAEDVLEEFELEARRNQRKVLYLCSKILPNMARLNLCRRLNAITKKFEEIAYEINTFNFKLDQRDEVQIPYIGKTQAHPHVDEKKIIGRQKDKDDIVRFLINRDSTNKKNIMVLPIVAMGGMGKTALTQLVYNDRLVEHHFQLRIWVYVSNVDFDVVRLVRLIIESTTGKECTQKNMGLLQGLLRESISGKRCLIVLDDVWNEDPRQWGKLKTLLDCGGEGSTVLVSTRSKQVAKMMATTSFIHYLKELPEEDNWELFRSRAFEKGEEVPETIIKIGKDITNLCCNLPLAIDTLGSMMQNENNVEKWKAMLDNGIWKVMKDKILPSLRLSYNCLPRHMKQCFTFCAMYPKDYWMEKNTLIQLWMANGFISADGNEDLDIKGRDIFDQLVWSYFFQNVTEVTNYKYPSLIHGYRGIVICKMHNLMHDLAQSIMGNDCLNFADTLNLEDIPSSARHLLMLSLPKSICSWNNSFIRTIVMPEEDLNPQTIQIRHTLRLKSLRALKLCVMDSVINVRYLKHLRLLDLSYSKIKKVHKDICSLYNLQTLKLSKCENLKKLPDNLTDLVNLRHLYIDGCNSLTHMPRGMGRLKHLHTLTMYVVNVEADRGIKELCDLNLYGTLELRGIEKVSNAIDAQHANISSKKNLQALILYFDGDSVEVFEALKPHDELKLLKVSGYKGHQFPEWLNVPPHLKNLVEINLHHCEKCNELPPLWQLPFLEKLELFYMDEVKHIINNTTCSDGDLHTKFFPSLKRLHIFNMKNLESLPQGMKSLINLTIRECDRLTSIPEDLTKLDSLLLRSCNFIESLPQGMGSLTNLCIHECNRLISLSGDLTELIELDLKSCNVLKSLPQEMKNLRILNISNCKEIILLPEAFHVQFPNLSSLKIIGHDELIRPFQFGGDCWHLIENIPKRDIRLDEHYLKSSTSGEKM